MACQTRFSHSPGYNSLLCACVVFMYKIKYPDIGWTSLEFAIPLKRHCQTYGLICNPSSSSFSFNSQIFVFPMPDSIFNIVDEMVHKEKWFHPFDTFVGSFSSYHDVIFIEMSSDLMKPLMDVAYSTFLASIKFFMSQFHNDFSILDSFKMMLFLFGVGIYIWWISWFLLFWLKTPLFNESTNAYQCVF